MSIPQFTAETTLPKASTRYRFASAGPAGAKREQVVPALVGRWHIPWTNCDVECIEVCVRFCGPEGWDCCGWETRCALNCSGTTILTLPMPA